MKGEEALRESFAAARLLCLSALPARDGGIGTLGEKTLHRMLKYTWEPDDTRHEIPCLGYVADIKRGERIVEIQTRSFEHLVPKLGKFLEEYRVTVVYPLPQEKILHTIDPESGEIGKGRKSPKKCKVYDAFWELYKLKSLLQHPNLTVTLAFFDVEEYRRPTSRTRRRTERVERIPTRLAHLVTLTTPATYADAFLPKNLQAPFTVRAYAKAAGIKPRYASLGITLLTTLGVLTRDGKEGRAYLYRPSDEPAEEARK